MALVIKDRVKGTTTTTGTGTYTVDAAVPTGFQAVSVIGTGNTSYFVIEDGTNWESITGTVTVTGSTTVARTTIHASSNGGAAVNWGGGTRNIFVAFPASGFMLGANNLSEIANAAAARTILGSTTVGDALFIAASAAAARTTIGLGTAAVLNVGTGASEVVQRTASGAYPAGDGALLTNLPAGTPSVPANAVTDWYNTSAPSGWERVTTVNDRVPIIVSAGSPGTTNTETWNIEALTASGHSLTAAEIPGHTHDIAYSVFQGGSGGVGVIETIGTGSSQAATTSVGGGDPHTHGVVSAGTWRPPAAYMLLGRKL